MGRRSRRVCVSAIMITTVLLAAAFGSYAPLHGPGQLEAAVDTDDRAHDSEMIRIGLRYGASAVNEIAIEAQSGRLIVHSVDLPEGVVLLPGGATVRAVATDSRVERVYRLSVGAYTDPLGAEKRLAELSASLAYPVATTVGIQGRHYVAYIGSSASAEEMDRLRVDLGLSDLDSHIEAYDVPYGLTLEVVPDAAGFGPFQIGSGYVAFASEHVDGVVCLGSPLEGYRGSIEVLLSPEGLLEVVNVVALEDYLRSAVGSEMSSYAPVEALKVQAVLMRTYAVNHMAASKHDRFDVCNTHHCQVYRGIATESARIDTAVKATSGQILGSYSGTPVQVYYHATCGGQTEASADVWGNRFPHLVSRLCSPVSEITTLDLSSDSAAAEFIKSNRKSYCSDGTNYRWQRYLSTADLRQIVGTNESVVSLSVLRRTPAGRVAEIEIAAGNHSVVLTGDLEIRMALGDGGLLPSCFFVVEPLPTRDGDESSPVYVLVGAGYGHGVGLCQAGAVGMAKQGYDYRQILSHYFPGTSLVNP